MSKTQNQHETEPACSPQTWTSVFLDRNSVLLLCLHISKWKFHRAVFIIRTTRAYRTEGSVGQRLWKELNECVYQSNVANHWIKSEVGKTRDGRTSVTVKMGKTRDGTVLGTFSTDGFVDGYGNRKWSWTLLRTRECRLRCIAAVSGFPSTANKVLWRSTDYGSFWWVFSKHFNRFLLSHLEK